MPIPKLITEMSELAGKTVLAAKPDDPSRERVILYFTDGTAAAFTLATMATTIHPAQYSIPCAFGISMRCFRLALSRKPSSTNGAQRTRGSVRQAWLFIKNAAAKSTSD